jgi:cytochrome c biogenesis protein
MALTALFRSTEVLQTMFVKLPRTIMSISKAKTKPNAIWSFFSSVKLTIVLLIILAFASILGTLIPQMPQRESVEFARGLSPGLFRLFSSMNLFDMYHSFWFRLLIGCLAMNLFICSIDRLPAAWKRFRLRPSADRSNPFRELPPNQTFLTVGDFEGTTNQVAQVLKTHYKKIERKNSAGKYYFLGEKGRYSHFGVYLVHLSILIILIGGLVGSLFGFEGYISIIEGEQIDSITVRKRETPLKLGFEVRCDKFFVEFYENGAPKEYRSELSFSTDGKAVEKGSLLVNHPIKFRGITFYQSSYGKVPGNKVRLKIARHASNDVFTSVEAEQGKLLPLPGSEGRFQVLKTDGNLRGMMGPAALISIRPEKGDETRFWVFQNWEMLQKRFPGEMLQSPFLNPSSFRPYTFFLEDLESKFYTGLQVNRDPGVSIVWAGCFLMIGGFFVTFFMSHRRIWVRISREKGGNVISIAGTASKNPVGLQRELARLTHNLKDVLDKRK